MTTQHTHYEDDDVNATVVEQTPTLETTVAPTTFATAASDELEAQAASSPTDATLPPEAQEESQVEASAPSVAEIPAPSESEQQDQKRVAEQSLEAAADSEPQEVEHTIIDSAPGSGAADSAFPSAEAASFVETREEIRPFTSFIEEFREAEARFSASLQESQEEAFKLLSPAEGDLAAPEPPPALEAHAGYGEPLFAVAEAVGIEESSAQPPVEQEQGPVAGAEAAAEVKAEKAPPAARAVSPLLRPPSRVRLPRHSSSRHQREEATTAAPPAPESAPAPVETPPEPEAPRPARRYRFDRPAATTSSAQPAPSLFSRPEAVPGVSEQVASAQAKAANGGAQAGEQTTARPAPAQEPVPDESQSAAPAETGRRRSGSERQKEQAASAAAAPAHDTAAPAAEAPEAPGNIAPEDLPPLEYSELQKATSRRRRRHRSSSSNGTVASTPTDTPPAVVPQPPAAPSPSTNGAATSYTIVSGYTVNQMNQGNETTGPFMAPEPSPARGSVLTRDGRTIGRAETLRPQPPSHSVTRHEAAPSAASMNYFANLVAQAIQTQTDRMVAELRRSTQAPANISVSLPPFPSTERVGVFVDVANLLYSARTLRIAVDFGKLLDFLRGNRRLVRAHAYCPTSPQPGDEQMFLQAVKGLGYRITTKNYKTFSSGAKKADLDLDLCMDVVRLVDGRAVDCIVLVSGDSDFMPMLDYCSDHGVRVEVAAFDEAMSATLRQSCDLFINLSMLEEIRA